MGGEHKTKPIIINLLISVVLVGDSSVCNTGISWSIHRRHFVCYVVHSRTKLSRPSRCPSIIQVVGLRETEERSCCCFEPTNS